MSKPNGDSLRPEVKTAIALFYDGQGAPQITAKGDHAAAEEIVRIAHQNDVPLCDNAALVGLLSQIELGERVPEDLYKAVAYVLAFAYKLKTPKPAQPLATAPLGNPTNPMKI